MTDIVRYVDTADPAGNGGDGLSWATAYSSLQLWNASEAKQIPADDKYVVHCRASTGLAETNQVILDNWDTALSGPKSIEIHGEWTSTPGVWNTSAYRLESGPINEAPLVINSPDTLVNRLQLYNTYSDALGPRRYAKGISVHGGGTSQVSNCICKCSGEPNSVDVVIDIRDSVANSHTDVFNNVAYGGTHGINSTGSPNINRTCNVYNNTLVGNLDVGIQLQDYDTIRCVNNLITGTANAISSFILDAGGGTLTNQQNGCDVADPQCHHQNLNVLYVDATNEDYHLQETSDGIGIGWGQADDPLVPATDIDGDTRPQSLADIGFDQWAAAIMTVMMANYRRRRN